MTDIATIIGKALGVDPATLTDESGPKTVRKWDSMRAVVLLTALEKAYGLRFSHAEFDEMATVGQIKKVLRRHGRL
jgi:acyl carrier protein